IPSIRAISLLTFIIIHRPAGAYRTPVQASLAEAGDQPLDAAELARLTDRYGLNDPWYVQYWKWLSGILFHGDFGDSFSYGRPVSALVWERLPLTVMLSVLTLVFIWAVSSPIGVYSALRQSSPGDY